MAVLFAEWIDVAEKPAVPVGVALGLVILFATKSGRKSIDDGYTKGKALRARMTGKAPDEGTRPGARPSVWVYIAVGVAVAGAVLAAMSQGR